MLRVNNAVRSKVAIDALANIAIRAIANGHIYEERCCLQVAREIALETLKEIDPAKYRKVLELNSDKL